MQDGEFVDRVKPSTFLTIASASLMSGYSKRHVARLIEESGLPVHKMGDNHVIVRKDFLAFLEKRGAGAIRKRGRRK